jgi:membrane-bound lytic murein transglycosylase D
MLIPLAKADKFDYNLSHWDKPLLSWQVYTPSADENVASVAERYGMSTAELQNVNKLGSRNLTAGRPVLVALRGKSDGATPLDGTDSNLAASDSLIASAKPQAAARVTAQLKAPAAPVG